MGWARAPQSIRKARLKEATNKDSPRLRVQRMFSLSYNNAQISVALACDSQTGISDPKLVFLWDVGHDLAFRC